MRPTNEDENTGSAVVIQTQCVEVVKTVPGGCEVRPLPTHGCARCASGGGCQGGWFARLFLVSRGVYLPYAASPGQRLRLSMAESELSRVTRIGYGVLLLGLFAGAAFGALLAGLFHKQWFDLSTLLGSIVGLAVCLRLTRRVVPGGVTIQPMSDGAGNDLLVSNEPGR